MVTHRPLPVTSPPPYTERCPPPSYEPPPYEDIVNEENRQHTQEDVMSRQNVNSPSQGVVMSPMELHRRSSASVQDRVLYSNTSGDRYSHNPRESSNRMSAMSVNSATPSEVSLSTLGVADIGVSIVSQTGSNVNRSMSRPPSYSQNPSGRPYSSYSAAERNSSINSTPSRPVSFHSAMVQPPSSHNATVQPPSSRSFAAPSRNSSVQAQNTPTDRSQAHQDISEVARHHQNVLTRQTHQPNIIMEDINDKSKSKSDSNLSSTELIPVDKMANTGTENMAYVESQGKSDA